METNHKAIITVETLIDSKIETVWKFWNEPQHIIHWCNASDDWHAPYADNDLRVNGKFKTTMAAKDGSFSFDFEGVYTHVELHKLIEYTILDGRKVSINFSVESDKIKVKETFEAESENSLELQKAGWQSILDNFKKYCEANR